MPSRSSVPVLVAFMVQLKAPDREMLTFFDGITLEPTLRAITTVLSAARKFCTAPLKVTRLPSLRERVEALRLSNGTEASSST